MTAQNLPRLEASILPAPEALLAENTMIYVITAAKGDVLEAPIKIGITQAPAGRLRTVQTSSPFAVAIAFGLVLPDRALAQKVERLVHDRLASCRLHSEWFQMHPLAAVYVVFGVSYEVVRSMFPQKSHEDVDAVLRARVFNTETFAVAMQSVVGGSLEGRL